MFAKRQSWHESLQDQLCCPISKGTSSGTGALRPPPIGAPLGGSLVSGWCPRREVLPHQTGSFRKGARSSGVEAATRSSSPPGSTLVQACACGSCSAQPSSAPAQLCTEGGCLSASGDLSLSQGCDTRRLADNEPPRRGQLAWGLLLGQGQRLVGVPAGRGAGA